MRRTGIFLVFFLLGFLTHLAVIGQVRPQNQLLHKSRVDTVQLARFEYATVRTNNGTDCSCNILNMDVGNIATIGASGAPDSVRFSNNTLFNGIHEMPPQGQLIALADFGGKPLYISNESPYSIKVLLSVYCPQNAPATSPVSK